MSFLGALGWILFSFCLGFFIGAGLAGQVYRNKKPDSDRKVAEK